LQYAFLAALFARASSWVWSVSLEEYVTGFQTEQTPAVMWMSLVAAVWVRGVRRHPASKNVIPSSSGVTNTVALENFKLIEDCLFGIPLVSLSRYPCDKLKQSGKE